MAKLGHELLLLLEGSDPRKADTSGAWLCYFGQQLRSRLHKHQGLQDCTTSASGVCYKRMHHRKASCRQAIGLSKTFLSRKTSHSSVALNHSARASIRTRSYRCHGLAHAQRRAIAPKRRIRCKHCRDRQWNTAASRLPTHTVRVGYCIDVKCPRFCSV
ncbi:hypothetical protein FRC0088_02216 [Corynebacterium diphtheriae]|nr:hypothetical protein FRC0088_02216 [Corynebacterium diphtheriae]